jgi:hypothetical protein
VPQNFQNLETLLKTNQISKLFERLEALPLETETKNNVNLQSAMWFDVLAKEQKNLINATEANVIKAKVRNTLAIIINELPK